jgi:phage shock protein A
MSMEIHMNIIIELETQSAHDRICEAKKDLIDLMAEQIRCRREIAELNARINEYEGYALSALDKNEQPLAREIAAKIAMMESHRNLQERSNALVFDQVSRLKMAIRRFDERDLGLSDNLQYQLDYLEAAAELADDSWALERKMFAAGIGRRVSAGQAVLERIELQRRRE